MNNENLPTAKGNTVEVANIIGKATIAISALTSFCYCFTVYVNAKYNRTTDLRLFNETTTLYSQPV